MLLVLLLFLTGIMQTPPDTVQGSPTHNIKSLESRIRSEILNQPGVYGIAFKNLSGEGGFLINAHDMMHAASTMKTPVMMRLFEMIDAGELRLDEEIPVKNSFKSIIDGSAFSLEEDPNEPLFQHLGGSLTVEELMNEMITKSSNMATNILIEKAKATEVMKLMRRLGIEEIEVLRGVEDLKAYNLGKNNRSSANAMMEVMIACAQSTNFKKHSRDKMLSILRQQHYNEMIPSGIPKDSGAKIAHKTGSISTVEHDAAIVDLPNGQRYALVIFVRDFENRQTAQHVAQRISRHIFHFMNSTN